MAAETAFDSTPRRELYLDRRVCTITDRRIDIHPARSIVILPLITLIFGLLAFPVIFFWGGSLSIGLRFALTIAAVIIVPLSGLGVVYSIAGAHIVVERHKQSAVLQQGFLGMGVGTQELIPFWKFDSMIVRELTPHDYRGHHEDFAQYEIAIKKVSGREIAVGTVTVARAEAKEGLARAREIANIIADMAGSKVHVERTKIGPGATR
ncbi:MAG: hypothetical protein AB7P33_07090 [Dehalococcoidia bacterium]